MNNYYETETNWKRHYDRASDALAAARKQRDRAEAERDRARAEVAKLTDERDGLQVAYSTEHDRAEVLEGERDAARAEAGAMSRQLRETTEELKAIRGELRIEEDNVEFVEGQRDAALAALERVLALCDAAEAEYRHGTVGRAGATVFVSGVRAAAALPTESEAR